MSSNSKTLALPALPANPGSITTRLTALAKALLQSWREAREARSSRVAMAQLDPATRRDLGLDTYAEYDRRRPAIGHFDRYV